MRKWLFTGLTALLFGCASNTSSLIRGDEETAIREFPRVYQENFADKFISGESLSGGRLFFSPTFQLGNEGYFSLDYHDKTSNGMSDDDALYVFFSRDKDAVDFRNTLRDYHSNWVLFRDAGINGIDDPIRKNADKEPILEYVEADKFGEDDVFVRSGSDLFGVFGHLDISDFNRIISYVNETYDK